LCVFVQDISSPNALANVLALDAAVKRVHGRIISIRQIARRDAGTLHVTTPAHRQIVSDTQQRRVAARTHQFLHANGHVNPCLDFQAFDDRLWAYIHFTKTIDGITCDAQPKKETVYQFDFGECNLHSWKKRQLEHSNTRVVDLKPRNPGGRQGKNPKPSPIWEASKYAHITRRIENGYQED
jgi:hypothetical protein